MFVAYWLVRDAIVKPLRRLMFSMDALGEGRLHEDVTGTERKDEVGAMARTLDVLRGHLADAEDMRVAQHAARPTSGTSLPSASGSPPPSSIA